VGGLFSIEGMGVCGMGTEAGLSFSEESDVNNSISELVLPNNLSYNLCIGVSVFRKSLSSKMACVEQKMISPCV